MKQHLIFGLIVLLLLILLPLVSLAFGAEQENEPPPAQTLEQAEEPAAEAATVSVLRHGSGEVEDIAMLEYLVGVVAAEMPARFHEQALMAQAVAAHTFKRYRLEVAGAEQISDSPDNDQGYLCPQQRRERWGDQFDLYESRIENAVRAVFGQTLKYQGQPIFAAYHAMSGGITEHAAIYWGGRDLSFLRSVESPGDRLSPSFHVTTSFTAAEVQAALNALDGVNLTGEPAVWFGEPQRSEAGTVTEIQVGGAALTGRQVRRALDLRSSNFEIDYDDKGFHVTTAGFGHGVGMSQTGADFMARQGASYREILKHFYQGAEIA